MKITLLTGKTFDLQTAFDFNLKVLSSFKYKRLTLRIDTKNAGAVLTMPKLCSKKRAYDFVLSKQDWIINHLSKIPQVKDFQDGEVFSLFGKEVKICHLKNSTRAVYRENDTLYVGGDIVFLHRRIKDYIKKEAKKEFFKLSQELANKLDCKVANVTIKDTKSRWGSCSSLNNINYNWRIALAPEYVIKYLIAHEVAHLKHKDHSYAFWRCVKELYIGASMGKNWLKANGNKLFLYR
ncbi:MAG: M48 family metallopeptidase [Alphaproteobacteria bacterium]|nr:M48 family metallopeptidase [Alphaproteobacteria bacterium]